MCRQSVNDQEAEDEKLELQAEVLQKSVFLKYLAKMSVFNFDVIYARISTVLLQIQIREQGSKYWTQSLVFF